MTSGKSYIPKGVIPAALIAFDEDYSIDEKMTRKHLSDVGKVAGISAVTVNGHSSEVHACTVAEQERLLDLTVQEIGDNIPIINGIYSDGSLEAARLAKLADKGGASALLCFPPHSLGMGCVQHRPEMVISHFKFIADATDLPLIVFHYSDDLAYGLETLVRLAEEIPSIRAIKDWSPPQAHEAHIRVLQALPNPVNVLSTNSAWLYSSLVMGANGLLSGAGSVIADLQVELFNCVQQNKMAEANLLATRMWHITEIFYNKPFGDMHNRMKEALVILGRLDKAVVRPPLLKLDADEVETIRLGLIKAGIEATTPEVTKKIRTAAE